MTVACGLLAWALPAPAFAQIKWAEATIQADFHEGSDVCPIGSWGANSLPFEAYSGPPDSADMRRVGWWPDGTVIAVAVKDSFLVHGAGGAVWILNVADLQNPEKISETHRPDVVGYVQSLDIEGDLLYVAYREGGLRIIDISDPYGPIEVGHLYTSGDANFVDAVDTLAYVACSWEGLSVINVEDPSNLYEVGSCNTPGFARTVKVVGNYAYVGDDNEGLRIIDISDPTSPYEVGFWDTPGNTWEVDIQGDYAYLADYSGGLRIVDISVPDSAFEVGFLSHNLYRALHLQVVGSYAYVLNYDWAPGLNVIDISDPTNPFFVGQPPVAWTGYYYDIVVKDSIAYVGRHYGGTCWYGVSDHNNPTFINGYIAYGRCFTLKKRGDYAYVTDDIGLLVIDVSNPQAPYLAGRSWNEEVWHGSRTWDIDVQGDYAYLAATWTGLVIHNITDPSSPYKVGDYNPAESYDGIAVRGDYAYAATDRYAGSYGGLTVFDISDPGDPSVVGVCATHDGSKVALHDSFAYLATGYATGKGLRIINIFDPSDPFEVTAVDSNLTIMDVAISYPYAYLAAWYDGIRIVDIQDPLHPVVVNSVDPGLVAHLSVRDDRLCVVGFDNEPYCYAVMIFDLSDPVDPVQVGYYGINGGDVALDSRHLYVPGGDLGFFVLQEISEGISIILIPDEDPPFQVPQGGEFGFTGILTNNSDQPQIIDAWVMADVPGTGMYGPLKRFDNVSLSAYESISRHFNQNIPNHAPLGDYLYLGYCGDYPSTVVDSSYFPFEVVPGVLTKAVEEGWVLTGSFLGEDNFSAFPSEFALLGNYPNPFNVTTVIRCQLPATADVKLDVYNLLGERVETLLNGMQEAGYKSVVWDASAVSSGLYFYKLTAGDFTETRRMMLVK